MSSHTKRTPKTQNDTKLHDVISYFEHLKKTPQDNLYPYSRNRDQSTLPNEERPGKVVKRKIIRDPNHDKKELVIMYITGSTNHYVFKAL